MMKKKQPKRLVKQVLFLIVGILGIFLLVQIIVFVSIQRREKQVSQDYIENLVSSVEHTISSNLQNIERAGFAISYNDDLYDIFSQGADEPVNITSVLDMIKLIYYNNQGDLLDVSVVDLKGNQRSLLMGVSDEFYEQILALYDFSNDIAIDRKFIFFDADSPYRTQYYIYLAPLLDEPDSQGIAEHKVATIIFIGEMTSLKMAVNVVDPESAIIMITDTEGGILWSNQENPTQQFDHLQTRGEKITATQEIAGTNLKVSGFVLDNPLSTGQQLFRYAALSAVLLFLSLLVISIFIRKKILDPMQQLRGEIATVGREGLSQRLQLYESDEINHIASWINNMLGRLEQATDHQIQTQQKLFQTELLKNNAELYSLRTQINPHFLYNTLQCMRGIAMENDIIELADMCTALFEIFRYSIKGQEKTTIQKELSIARQYLHIFEVRFHNRFTYSINVSDEAMEYNIIKMTLQPILENSIYHGFRDVQENMHVDINIFVENAFLVVHVDDNGAGIPPERLSAVLSALEAREEELLDVQKDFSLGLRNVNRRLHFAFGAGYRMSVENLPQGTRVTLRIPTGKMALIEA